jgi:hypothetical protein
MLTSNYRPPSGQERTCMAIPLGITLAPCDDPTGNREDAAEIVRVKDDGTVLHSGFFLYQLAGQKVRGYLGNASADAGQVFEVSSAGQTIVAPVGNDRLVIGVE